MPEASAPSTNWACVASSADGSHLVAASGPGGLGGWAGAIYISTDSGVTWTRTSAPGENWSCIASSADGTKLVAGGTWDTFYTSTDSGATWQSAGGRNAAFISVASSADGTTLAASVEVPSPYNSIGELLISTNRSISWRWTVIPWGHAGPVALSAGGTRVVTGPYASPICISTNSGVSIALTSSPGMPWTSVASSADGAKLVAAGSGGLFNYPRTPGPIYFSGDSGTTWQDTSAPVTNWAAVASSADGCKLVAVVNGGAIYARQTASAPVLSITPSASNLCLSWTVPSTNLVLQEITDLRTTNWTEVAPAPVLNLTNLQNQVVVPVSTGSGFYRLKSL